jgi:hypothetical protein
MLSFIRKRLPSKDRNNEHLQHVKPNHIQHEHQVFKFFSLKKNLFISFFFLKGKDEMERTQSANELNMNNNQNKKKKKNAKKKTKSSLTLDELVHASNTSSTVNQINKSYSDVDYFPMMPGALSPSNNHDKISKDRGRKKIQFIPFLLFNFFLFDRFII